MSPLPLLIGTLCGLLTGLVPGLHINALAAVAGALLGGSGADGAGAVVAMTVAHGFVEVVPVLLLGAPADDAYALQPAHRLVASLGGRRVVALCVQAMWGSLLVTALLTALLAVSAAPVLEILSSGIRPLLGPLLLLVSVWLISRERAWRAALGVWLASGLLGLVVLDTGLVANDPTAAFTAILPALTGLFGLSGVLAVLTQPGAERPQPSRPVGQEAAWSDVLVGTAAGIGAGFLPGLGAANLAAITSAWRPLKNDQRYVVVTSAINMANTVFALVMWVVADRIRSGPAATLRLLAGAPDASQLVPVLVAVLVGAFGASLWLAVIIQPVQMMLQRLNPLGMAAAVGLALCYMVVATTGLAGTLILTVGTIIGTTAIRSGIARSHAMGFFLLPVTLYYLGWRDAVYGVIGIDRAVIAGRVWDPWSLGLLVLAMAGAGILGYRWGASAVMGSWQVRWRGIVQPEAGPDAAGANPLPDDEDDETWGDWTAWS